MNIGCLFKILGVRSNKFIERFFTGFFKEVYQLFLKLIFIFRVALLMGLSKLNQNQLNTERGGG